MTKLSCVLLVDDDSTSNFLNQSLLEDLAITEQILVAHNGVEALDVLQIQCTQDNCPQLILLDINMPVMDGFEFLAAYKNLGLDHQQSVVIVMLTTSLNPSDVKQVDPGLVQGYLNKPLTKEMVHDLLQRHFNQHIS
jgi:CheY-like chemotaxis protein